MDILSKTSYTYNRSIDDRQTDREGRRTDQEWRACPDEGGPGVEVSGLFQDTQLLVPDRQDLLLERQLPGVQLQHLVTLEEKDQIINKIIKQWDAQFKPMGWHRVNDPPPVPLADKSDSGEFSAIYVHFW